MENGLTHRNWWYQQLFTNWKRFELVYVALLILLQLVVYLIAPDSLIGMVSGVGGVLCLVYGMKGRKISFIFGFIQCVAMAYVAWISHAYGSFAMDLIYVISQPIGWYLWGRDEVTRAFTRRTRRWLFIGAFIAWLVGWGILSQLGGQLPYFDAINFVVSLIAQVLYILKFRENWSLWIVVNIANVVYWGVLTGQTLLGMTAVGTLGANLSQVALQGALLFNAVYATKVWASGAADHEGGAGQ
ncbi:nicotinamide mononucleotide transporter [Levilactobacillus brevis]|uniref:Nicotinamide mononucleotide transporter n=1 Tax=Levilactobacillus brevis TaxID=1580 RepID=A0AAJ5FII4_LEVBR|nr:nicotinamide riboside transporter PnuC [Levilactobacillus brevis]ARN90333.1 nicotinamide mononucleotide transporter [Levilactobacillus brevis]ARN97966.1 nicotinamide mononucleotide transporter [Levilactobacillus brevis]AWP46389.1 nicotinamide mononucleotide transporter [Levilactobacillus brevis]MCT3567516.1 nicotinamide mononucleotide transporter [Levilactobacillus brevis]RAY09667.1 nicotinamide mononucleotide transporter [Levilactobacillus brevis]